MSRRRGGRAWKLIGLAGLAGVTATGVLLARDERRRRTYTPDEIRSRLQERYAQAGEAADADSADEQGQGDQRPPLRP